MNSFNKKEIHCGFIPKGKPFGDWTNERVLHVKYIGGKNSEVTLEISSQEAKQYDLAYTIKFCTLPKNRCENFQTENRFITLDDAEGRFVKLPVINFAKPPFQDHQFSIQVSTSVR